MADVIELWSAWKYTVNGHKSNFHGALTVPPSRWLTMSFLDFAAIWGRVNHTL
jgi:hypothetical protein